MNNVNLIGRLTKDVELRKTPTGVSVVPFTLAVNEGYGEKQYTNYIECVAYRAVADVMYNHLSKGSKIGIEGRIHTRNYKNQQDRTVYVTEVIAEKLEFLDSKQKAADTSATQYGSENGSTAEDYGSDTLDIASDDLPF